MSTDEEEAFKTAKKVVVWGLNEYLKTVDDGTPFVEAIEDVSRRIVAELAVAEVLFPTNIPIHAVKKTEQYRTISANVHQPFPDLVMTSDSESNIQYQIPFGIGYVNVTEAYLKWLEQFPIMNRVTFTWTEQE